MLDRLPALWWVAAAMLMLPTSAYAQWWVDLGMGRSSYEENAPQLETENASIGLRYSGVNWIELGAGLPFGTASGAWGSAAAGGRWTRDGSATIGIAGTGQLFAQDVGSASGLARRGGFVEATPLLRVATDVVDVELRAGVLAIWNDYDGENDTWFVPSTSLVMERWLSDRTHVEASGRMVRVEGDHSATVSLAANYDELRWGVWGRVGRLFSALEHANEWAAGAYLRATDRLQLYASLYQEADDPIHATSARLTWSLGLGLALGASRARATEALPLEVSSRQVVFHISRDEVEGTPSIAGDFTGWSTHPMQPTRDGWEVRFDLAPGLYRFAFVNGQGDWFLPPSVVHRADDSFGGENGVVVVR